MFRSILIAFIMMLSVSVMANGPLPEHPWGFADTMVSYKPGPSQYDPYPDPKPFHDPDLALGAPHGLLVSEADNSSVVTLGDRGRIVLQFNQPVKDDPDNPGGYDFIVFSNCLWVGNSPYYRWQELAYVEISNDGVEWFLIPPDKPVSALVGASSTNTAETRDTGHSYTVVRNYAEYTPTLGLPIEVTRTPEEFYCIPDRQSAADNDELLRIDAVSGGGDAFDIAEAVKQERTGVPLLDTSGNMIPAGITEFKYIRIWDALSGDFQPDVHEISAEIDAVADVRPAETLGKAKQKQDGEFAVIRDVIVTAVFTDPFFTRRQEIFIQSEDRSAAIRLIRSLEPLIIPNEPEPIIHIVEPFPVNVGDLVSVTGHISTSSGEKVITDPLVTKLESGKTVSPLGMYAKAVQGNPARFVRTWGQVKENGFDYFVINGGSADLKIWSDMMLQQPVYGAHVSVTGVMGPVNEEMGLRVWRQEDIVTY